MKFASRGMMILLAVACCLSASYSVHANPVQRSEIVSQITGKTYHLDARNGDDVSGNGTSVKPWRTLQKAMSVASGGDGVILADGNYDAYSENSDPGVRNGWITYLSASGSHPEISGIYINYGGAANRIAYLRFYGLKIAPPWRDPGPTPPYKRTNSPVRLENVQKVEVINCELVGTNKYLTPPGVYLTNTREVLIESCWIHKVARGIQAGSSTNCVFRYNHIEEMIKSCFYIGWSGNPCSDILIEGNHGHNSRYNSSDKYYPTGTGDDPPHASAVAIRSSNVTIRNNIFHDGFNSAGIMTYDGAQTRYDNIILENNLLYDIWNPYPVRFYHLGANCVVRNNTIIGKKIVTNDERYRYGTAFIIHNPGTGSPSLLFDNNIVVGRAAFGSAGTYVKRRNNISWFLDGSSAGVDAYGNRVIVDSYHDKSSYFEDTDGFFTGPVRYDAGHGNWVDFTLKQGSEGINFGNPALAPSDCLGPTDSGNGFVIPSFIFRGDTRHSVGAYEYSLPGGTVPPHAPKNLRNNDH